MMSELPHELIANSPLYIQHHNDALIAMPSVRAWRSFCFCEEFQRVLPAPITRTIQTSMSLRGYRVYSLLMSDGDKLVTHKMMTKDAQLFFFVQIFELERLLEQLKRPPQVVTTFNRCFSIAPVPQELPESFPAIAESLKTMLITTYDFIYSLHLDRDAYRTSV